MKYLKQNILIHHFEEQTGKEYPQQNKLFKRKFVAKYW